MIYRPHHVGAFEFAVLAARRAEQLSRGCLPRIDGHHNTAVTALLEVIAGKVEKAGEGAIDDPPDARVQTQIPAAFSDEAHHEPEPEQVG
jgi:hypothetical protein